MVTITGLACSPSATGLPSSSSLPATTRLLAHISQRKHIQNAAASPAAILQPQSRGVRRKSPPRGTRVGSPMVKWRMAPDILATRRWGAVVAALTLIAKQFRRGVPGLRPRDDSTCRAKPLGLAGLLPAGLADDG